MENSKRPEFYEPVVWKIMYGEDFMRAKSGAKFDGKFCEYGILSKILKIWRTGSKFRAIKDCRNHNAKSCIRDARYKGQKRDPALYNH